MIRIVCAAVIAAVMTACSAAMPVDGRLPLTNGPQARGTPPLLFVLRSTTTSVELQEIPAGSKQPVRVIGSLAGIRGFALDQSGTAFILEDTAAGWHVDEYAAGTVKPSRTIVRGLNNPTFIRVDQSGNLYVLDDERTLVKYAPGSVEPALTIPLNRCGVPESVVSFAVDTFGTVYVSCGKLMQSQRQTISEYDGSPNLARSFHVPQSRQVLNLTTDPSGRLYVQYVTELASLSAGVIEYDRGSVQPAGSYALPSADGAGPLFYDTLDDDWIESLGACFSDNGGRPICKSRIYALRAAAGTVVTTITPPPEAIFGLPALDENGNLYVGLLAVLKNTVGLREYPGGDAHGWRTLLSGTGLALLGVWPSAFLSTESPTATTAFAAGVGRATASCDAGGTCQAQFR